MANLAQETFTLWQAFPAEIQSLVMEHCHTNDLVCLRLTCKTLYNLSPIRQHVPLSNTDFSLETKPLCLHSNSSIIANNWLHKRECHTLSYTYLQKQFQEGKGKEPKKLMNGCRTSGSKHHCECYTSWGRRSKLAYRLRGWVPKNLKYCPECGVFNRRRASHKGRCYHGQGKPRTSPHNFWTHRSRNGAFGRKLWKKWVNNAAMNKYESRLRRGQIKRADNTRYALRSLAAQEVDTSSNRDSRGPIIWATGTIFG